ncbi:MAG: TIGR01777 family oxidoreductase [Desulfobacterales bacterium]|nr:MAG: TIGR01777 family oxidoreductase [Desulfobacterales bacterium]
MKIFITGGLGFIGSNLSNYLLNQGHQVTAVGRPSGQQRITHDKYRYLSADTTQPGPWQEALNDIDAVVNLAGKSIFKRWSKKYKKHIYDSRILTTRNLVEALPVDKDIIFCSTSAVGYYGNRGDDILDEDQTPGDDFLACLSVDWEKEALRATAKGIRVVVMRFGIILGKNGGALSMLIPAFKSFIGGPIGSGDQWFPWMHLDDLMRAIVFVIEHPEANGPINFCAPKPIRNKDLAKTLGEVLHRPSFMPAPAFMIRLVLGEFGGVLLGSQRTVPEKLLSFDFKFQYPDIKEALQAIVS